MEKKSFDEFIELIQPILEEGHINLNYGECEGDNVVVFDSWDDLHYVEAYINGFKGLEKTPYIPDNKNLIDLRLELESKVDSNPDHWGYKSDLKHLNTYILYKQFMANIEEPISLNDFDFDCVFSDEYDRCCECGAIIRTSPDSYSWTPPLFIDCEGYACDNCVSEGKFDSYVLEEYCNVQKSIPDSIDLDRIGLVKINKDSYQNGFHSGMDDSPEPIIKALNEAGIDVWFKVYPSQFYCEFDVLVKVEDTDRATSILNGTDTYQGYSTAGNLEKALRSVSLESAKDSSEGIRYTKIDVSNGTSTTRVVSKEEFIKGIKD